jgi:alkylation response protein AidB-like acyl-CoA dehydrogenase
VKRLIVGAAASQVYLVTARTQAGVALYAIDRHAPGLVEEQEWHADGTPATRLILSDVVVASSNLILDETRSIAAIQSAIADATVMASAELFGLMSRLLEMTIDYMKIRVQFGRPIGAFQALQHKAVDLLILQALTASVIGEGCSSMAHLGLGQRRMLAARVKARASDAALKIAREAVQLHGAIAIQDECDVGLYLKRIMTVSAWSGTASVQRKLYASLSRDSVQKSGNHPVVRV